MLYDYEKASPRLRVQSEYNLSQGIRVHLPHDGLKDYHAELVLMRQVK